MLLFCENEVKVCSFTLGNIEAVADGGVEPLYSDLQTDGQVVSRYICVLLTCY